MRGEAGFLQERDPLRLAGRIDWPSEYSLAAPLSVLALPLSKLQPLSARSLGSRARSWVDFRVLPLFLLRK